VRAHEIADALGTQGYMEDHIAVIDDGDGFCIGHYCDWVVEVGSGLGSEL